MILETGNNALHAARCTLQAKNLKREACSVKRKEGFTLVEVLLTVTILAIGIIGVLRAYAVSVNSLGIGQENIDAVCLLKEKMSEIEQDALKQKGILPETSTGEFGGNFADYKWELDIKPSTLDSLNEVKLTVFHKESTRKFTLWTYVENKNANDR